MVSLVRQRDLLFVPELMERPEGERALVLSPHCDDDVIGLGGMMHGHGLAGHDVTVVYFTTPVPQGKGKSHQRELRKQEARKATERLGAFDLLFLDQPEGKLKPDRQLIDRLVQIIHDARPDVLYLPWFLDNHVDHLAVNELLLHASSRCRPACMVYGYEVWTPMLPNRLLDVTDRIEVKKEALSHYTSQLAKVDLLGTTLALNRYRSVTHLKGAGYAEAFLRMGLAEYLRMAAAFRQRSILGGGFP
jgi:LmbE family N-acetylglucosaminyl deacetylase